MSGPGNFWQDPYPAYTALRDRGPVHYSDDVEAWIVTGHEAARAALNDPALSSRWLNEPPYNHAEGVAIDHVRDWLIWQDPPMHQILRAQVASLFTARTAGKRAADIQDRVRAGYRQFVAAGGGDALQDMARPVVSGLIADLVGLNGIGAGILHDWSAAAGALMARAHHRQTRAEADAALAALAAVLPPTGNRQPGTSRAGTTILDRAEADFPGGSATHLASLFAFAGIETTTQAAVRMLELIASGELSSDAAPEDSVAAALRYDTPVPQVPRVASRNTELLGCPIAAGDRVVVLLAAANHDPEIFADSEEPRTLSSSERHLAYGHGRHRCLGAPLANAVLACLAFEVRQHPAPRLAQPAVWHRDRGHRGIARLDVFFDRPAGG